MSHRILLCEDEFAIAKAAGFKLTKCGHVVDMQPDGESGWSAYQAQRPSLLLTDLQMPRLDGLALIRRIREHDRELPIILLTAKGYEVDEAALSAELGHFRLFSKPFSPRELSNAVSEMLLAAPVQIVG